MKLNKQELLDYFESQKRLQYKKHGKFLYRQATPNETILTIVVGKLEALKIAGLDDIVLRNIELGSSAETYIIDKKIFEKIL